MNYYEILNISTQATDKEIKIAFKKLAWQYHPDQNPNDKKAEETFKLISEAYHTLSDATKRQFYDAKIGLRQNIDAFHYYKTYQKKEQEEREVKKAVFQDFIKKFRAERQAKQVEVQQTIKKTNFWIGIFLAFFVVLVVILNFLDIRERDILYQNALFYYKNKQLKKSDSIIHSLMHRKPRNEKYYLLSIKILIEQEKYDIAYKKLHYSNHDDPEYTFWELVCRYQTKQISATEILNNFSILEKQGFKNASLYFWRALIKFEILTDKQTICQDLHLAATLGEWKAEQYFYVCE
jgi:curved DNA-binding protein CbpA